MPLSAYSMDKFVAPEMSAFTEANIQDMSAFSAEQGYWVQNFILNNVLRGEMASPHRQYMFNFLRRVEAAFREYGLARERTLAHIENKETVSNYVAAISHWEVTLSQMWHAYRLIESSAGLRKSIFVPGDGSVFQRLNKLYNRSKHAEDAIGRGELLDDATMCIWLKNDGLAVTGTALTFGDLTDLLADLGEWAACVQDPLTMVSKVEAKVAKDKATGS